ncbi:MAG TPA: hypothetical protein VGB79_09370 [Allosphingosinicella sp.]
MSQPLPVICDRCRARGDAGEGVFAGFGALLDFDPVPRRTNRADGWDEEVQRTFIAALSLTGSVRAACRAVGKSVFGVTQLLAADGSEGFAAAHDQAMALACEERRRRLAEGLAAVAGDESGWRPPEGPWAQSQRRRGRPPKYVSAPLPELPPPPSTPAEKAAADAAAREEFTEVVLKKYLLKLQAERRARLDGRIVEADYYVRQLTWIEMLLDLGSGNGWRVLEGLRRGDYHAIDIAGTPFSRILDEARRLAWAEKGEPPRPEHPPGDLTQDHGEFHTEPSEFATGGDYAERQRQEAETRARHEAAARAQIEWEESAREESRTWRERLTAEGSGAQNPSPISGEGGARPRSGWEGEGTPRAD